MLAIVTFKQMNQEIFVLNIEADSLLLTAQKMKFSIRDFFSKYDQIGSLLRKFISCAMSVWYSLVIGPLFHLQGPIWCVFWKMVWNFQLLTLPIAISEKDKK